MKRRRSARLAKRLLRLYPRRWRERFESEMCAVLDEYPVRLTTIADLAAGAMEAWLDPAARKLEEGWMANGEPKGRRQREVRCSFCGKKRDQVKKLVAGPGVYICDVCVELCHEVLAQAGIPKAGGSRETPAAPPPARRRDWLRRIFFRSSASPRDSRRYSPTSPS